MIPCPFDPVNFFLDCQYLRRGLSFTPLHSQFLTVCGQCSVYQQNIKLVSVGFWSFFGFSESQT